MKNILILISAFFFTYASFAQTTPGEIQVKSNFFGTQFTRDGQRLSMSQMQQIMEPNPEAFKNIKSARSNNTFAGIIGAAGGFMIGWPVGTSLGGGDPNWTMAAVGAGLVVVSIPLSISANKKAKKAVELYNAGLKNTSSTNRTEFNFRITGNNFGVTVCF